MIRLKLWYTRFCQSFNEVEAQATRGNLAFKQLNIRSKILRFTSSFPATTLGSTGFAKTSPIFELVSNSSERKLTSLTSPTCLADRCAANRAAKRPRPLPVGAGCGVATGEALAAKGDALAAIGEPAAARGEALAAIGDDLAPMGEAVFTGVDVFTGVEADGV